LKSLIPTLVLIFCAMIVTAQQDATTATPVAVDAAAAEAETAVAPAKAVEQSTGGLWLAIGPDMQMLPVGTYRFIFVPADSTSNVEVTTITTGTGGPTPPPVGDLAARTSAALAKVTEAGKKTTATALLTVFEETNKSIASGSLTDQTQVSAALNLVLTYATAGKAGWGDFVKLAGDTLTASTSIKATEAALNVFITELKKL
jgi:hypothetical protein